MAGVVFKVQAPREQGIVNADALPEVVLDLGSDGRGDVPLRSAGPDVGAEGGDVHKDAQDHAGPSETGHRGQYIGFATRGNGPSRKRVKAAGQDRRASKVTGRIDAPVDPQPAKAVEDGPEGLLDVARAVGVVDEAGADGGGYGRRMIAGGAGGCNGRSGDRIEEPAPTGGADERSRLHMSGFQGAGPPKPPLM